MHFGTFRASHLHNDIIGLRDSLHTIVLALPEAPQICEYRFSAESGKLTHDNRNARGSSDRGWAGAA